MSDIEVPDKIGATRRAETIRQGMVGYSAAMDALGEAYEARDWVTLGHPDWDTYCEKEFSEKRLKLTREQREQAVLAFRGAGMSTRAIGAALGVDDKTVRNDLRGAENSAPAEVRGTDGKTYSAARPTSPAGPTPGPFEELAEPASSEDHTDVDGDRPAPDPSTALPEFPGVTSGSAPAEQEEPRDGSPPADERPQAAAGVSTPAAAPQPDEDDPERVRLEMRERMTQRFCESLVNLSMAFGDDPVKWLEEIYLPGAYKMRDLPRVRDCFTPESIKALASRIYAIGDHLHETGLELR